MLPDGLFEWDVDALAAGMRLPADRIQIFFRDGRRMAWLLEESLATRYGLERLGETDSSDLKAMDGGLWEVRGCSKGGVFFAPSGHFGKGRKFDIIEYLEKQRTVAGWIVADIQTFPRVSFWIIPRDIVAGWHRAQLLGANTHISREKFHTLISGAAFAPVRFNEPKLARYSEQIAPLGG